MVLPPGTMRLDFEKWAPLAHRTSRGQMATKKKSGGVFFGTGREFSKAYPMLANAVLIHEEFDFSGLVGAAVHSVRQEGYIVTCSSTLCHEGGYDLRPEIELMMSRDPMRSKAVHWQCDGWERKPKSKRSKGDICTGSIEGTLELKLRGKGRWRSA